MTRSEAVRPREFSTVGLPHHRRIELWEGHNAAALIGLRCRVMDAGSLEATEINVQLDQVQLARVTGSSHVVERDSALIRRRPVDSIAMFFTLVGEAFFYHEDGVRVLRPGQVLVWDADRPFMRGFSRGLEELVVKVPRAALADRAGMGSLRLPIVLDFAMGMNPYATALARCVGQAARSTDPLPADERTVVELAAVLATGGRAEAASAHCAAARAYIERHLADPGLSASRVAAAVGVSTRHLSRVFAADGLSVPRYILDRRLERAHGILRGTAARQLTIAEIAGRCGFVSATHFSRAFVRRYGLRASEIRRQAIVARAAAGD